jgi:PST family polysaccharide transporter
MADTSISRRTLDSHLAKGAVWTAVSKWSAQIISWASMLVLARLLAPSDYGLVGMASVYLGLIGMVSEFGLGSAIVTLRELTDVEIRQLHTFALLLGLGAFLVSVASARPLALFFHSPELTGVVLVMSLGFLAAGLRTVPTAILQRDMEFKRLSLAEATQAVLQALSAVTLAWFGFRYWSLAIAAVVGGAVLTVILFVLRPCGVVRPHPGSVRHALRFGSHMLVSRLAWYAYSTADFLVAGKFLGPAPLGYYTIAWNLASVPVEKITNILTNVTPSILSSVRDNNEELRRYLARVTEVLSLITFPAAFGLAVVAPDVVRVVLGAKWMAAAPALRLLAAYASVRSIASILSQVLFVKGETRFVMHLTTATALVMPPAFAIGAHWGIEGIAWAWMIAHPMFFAASLSRTLSRIGMAKGEYVRCLQAPVVASGVMAAVLMLIHPSVVTLASAAVSLAIQILVAAAAYTSVLFIGYRKHVLRYVNAQAWRP